MDLILSRDSAKQLERIINNELLDKGVTHAFIVDSSGNLILERGSLPLEDLLPLAALSAANFGASERMAQLIGESDFTLLFHKGTRQNIHFARVSREFILVTLFSNDVPLGLVRLGSGKVTQQALPLLRCG
ncbi:MAG TPA: roadblock/LC7 domain-containing protein [Syntrophobacteraceae bacterium]|nr:roadblock/LC7 domain-containing protein [Syntrophobacteraceae bacterium]